MSKNSLFVEMKLSCVKVDRSYLDGVVVKNAQMCLGFLRAVSLYQGSLCWEGPHRNDGSWDCGGFGRSVVELSIH